MEYQNIPLTEEFAEHGWVNYDSYDSVTREHLAHQNHVDIRTFTADSEEAWQTGYFNGKGEPEFVTYGYLAERGNYPGMVVTVDGSLSVASAGKPLDLLTGFEPTDIITFATPEYPSVEQAFIELTSDPSGNCGNSEVTAAVPFTGGGQVSLQRSLFEQNKIDLSRVTGVRFSFVTNAEVKITIMGLRLVSAAWVPASVDFDNWNGRLRKPVPLTGDPKEAPVFTQATLWHANPLPGVNDPQPVNAKFGVAFNTGSLSQNSALTLFFRERSEIFQTQLDLQGKTMAELDGRPQPDLGTEEFLPRPLFELDNRPLHELDQETLRNLERTAVANPVEQSWVYFTLQWGPKEASLTMNNNSTSLGYNYPSLGDPLLPHTDYLLVVSLEDSQTRVRLYKLEEDMSVNQHILFDSTLIDDDNIFRRRQGRLGWQASLGDADAFIRSIRPRGVTFAEYLSEPLESVTPVDGAQVFATEFSNNLELWDQGFSPTPEDEKVILLARDSSRALTAESFKVQTLESKAPRGLVTTFMPFTDFEQAEVHFSIWFSGEPTTYERLTVIHPAMLPGPHVFPSPELFPGDRFETTEERAVPNIIANLINEHGAVYPLEMPELETNQWQTVKLFMPDDIVVQTGNYALQILQPTHIASTWWVDAVSIFQRAVQFSARAVVDDPWKSNYAPWTDFRDNVNVQRRGILLSPRGKELQMRIRALTQSAVVKEPKIAPRYAQLGRLVWPEDKLTGLVAPTTFLGLKEAKESIVGGEEAKEFVYRDYFTVPGTGAIMSREWDFGDGQRATGNSAVVKHKYSEPGVYIVTLTVTDRNGQRASAEQELELL